MSEWRHKKVFVLADVRDQQNYNFKDGLNVYQLNGEMCFVDSCTRQKQQRSEFLLSFQRQACSQKVETNQVTMHGSMLSDLEPHPFTFLLFLD